MDNPLRVGLAYDRIPEPCTIVIFGASGDLTRRKLVPALYSLAAEGQLPPGFAVVGFARKPTSDDEFRSEMHQAVSKYARKLPIETATLQHLQQGMFAVTGDYDDPASYARLKERLAEIEARRGISHNRVFYLSTPPETFPVAARQLGAAGLIERDPRGPFSRLIVEKPFGVDLESARSLNLTLAGVLREDQIYRIDHYLGKETVQNLMVLRFANSLFEPVWNSHHVDHVQITGAEAIGIEGRGGYFDDAGSLRDMVQNHLFQVLCLTAMEPPVSLAANDLRDEKVKLLKGLRLMRSAEVSENVVRAQYTSGSVLGRAQMGYHEESGVAPGSTTESFVAMRILIDNWRWAGVPFFLRSGKAMPKKVTEVALVFRKPPHHLFGRTGAPPSANVLAIRIQPDEGISIRFGSKVPGNALDIHPVNMEFRYNTSFGLEPPEAYERLLLDCMLGDASLYTRADEVEASWSYISRIHDAWRNEKRTEIPKYEAGTWGPPEADELLSKTGYVWRRP